ncbi:hypothetical protein, partial [Aromatoleum evansii]|uniref:hypothetical protein n=1 Tax=Aromatoleum evansii TaxID=59406 RepID=UPI001B7CF434
HAIPAIAAAPGRLQSRYALLTTARRNDRKCNRCCTTTQYKGGKAEGACRPSIAPMLHPPTAVPRDTIEPAAASAPVLVSTE